MSERRWLVACGATMLALAMLGCAAESPVLEGPAGAVQSFYERLNDGDFTGAKALYSAEALAVIDDPASDDEAFRGWAEQETKRRSIDRVQIVSSDVAESSATVQFEIHYADGSSAERQVALVDEAGEWKLGLIG